MLSDSKVRELIQSVGPRVAFLRIGIKYFTEHLRRLGVTPDDATDDQILRAVRSVKNSFSTPMKPPRKVARMPPTPPEVSILEQSDEIGIADMIEYSRMERSIRQRRDKLNALNRAIAKAEAKLAEATQLAKNHPLAHLPPPLELPDELRCFPMLNFPEV